jgi:hypothetical protein
MSWSRASLHSSLYFPNIMQAHIILKLCVTKQQYGLEKTIWNLDVNNLNTPKKHNNLTGEYSQKLQWDGE